MPASQNSHIYQHILQGWVKRTKSFIRENIYIIFTLTVPNSETFPRNTDFWYFLQCITCFYYNYWPPPNWFSFFDLLSEKSLQPKQGSDPHETALHTWLTYDTYHFWPNLHVCLVSLHPAACCMTLWYAILIKPGCSEKEGNFPWWKYSRFRLIGPWIT